MKKTISVIVAIAMMLMISIPAFAGNFDDNADLTAQQKVFAEVIYDGLTAGNTTADSLANYVGSNLDYKNDITSPDTIADDVSVALEAANAKLATPIEDENVINTMVLKLYATVAGHYQAANGEGSTNIGSNGSGSAILDKLFPDFSNGDFSDLFKGFGDSISQIGGAISGLLGGLGIGGSGSNNGSSSSTTKPATTKSSGSAKTTTASIPKTGDVALFAVAGVAVAAGLALVLTKKSKDSDEK